MSASDPIMFAALVSRMSDGELLRSVRRFEALSNLSDYQLALLDEARLRGLLASKMPITDASIMGAELR